jgi:hypothetical protein
MRAAMLLGRHNLAFNLFLQLEATGAQPSPAVARRALNAAELLNDDRYNNLVTNSFVPSACKSLLFLLFIVQMVIHIMPNFIEN